MWGFCGRLATNDQHTRVCVCVESEGTAVFNLGVTPAATDTTTSATAADLPRHTNTTPKERVNHRAARGIRRRRKKDRERERIASMLPLFFNNLIAHSSLTFFFNLFLLLFPSLILVSFFLNRSCSYISYLPSAALSYIYRYYVYSSLFFGLVPRETRNNLFLWPIPAFSLSLSVSFLLTLELSSHSGRLHRKSVVESALHTVAKGSHDSMDLAGCIRYF